jgi:hypothetical protein
MEKFYINDTYPKPLYESEHEIPLGIQQAEANNIFSKEGLKALGINPSPKNTGSIKSEDPVKKEMLDRLNKIKRHPLIKY